MTPFKILLCPLVTSDFKRAQRVITSCLIQKDFQIASDIHVVINSQDDEFIKQVSIFCKKNEIKSTVTQCDGTPATGKNSAFDVFLNSDCSHLSQIDGDDFFYPTFLKHMQRHLFKFLTTDVLATLPSDLISTKDEPRYKLLENGHFALCWFTNYGNYSTSSMFGEDRIFSPYHTGNYGRFVLYSRKVAERFRFDPEFIVGEDLKLHFEFLHAFQKDEICYWFSTASDTWVRDTSSFGVQKKHSNFLKDGEYHIVEDKQLIKKLKEYIENNMLRERSAPAEIPIDYAPVFLNHLEKFEFLEKFI